MRIARAGPLLRNGLGAHKRQPAAGGAAKQQGEFFIFLLLPSFCQTFLPVVSWKRKRQKHERQKNEPFVMVNRRRPGRQTAPASAEGFGVNSSGVEGGRAATAWPAISASISICLRQALTSSTSFAGRPAWSQRDRDYLGALVTANESGLLRIPSFEFEG